MQSSRITGILVTLGLAQVAWSQSPANQSAESRNGDNRVNTQTNLELYGNNTTASDAYRFHPYQTGVLPSEIRMARERSGALPSELRMNAEAAGPLSPSGGINYIPLQSPLQRAYNMPVPQLYNPAYVPNPQQYVYPNVPVPEPQPLNPGNYTLRLYPPAPASSSYLPPTMITGQLGSIAPETNLAVPGTVSYRVTTRATSRPTTTPAYSPSR